ncbi:PHD finger protein 20 isoform X4 [Spodoptera frugiperda]|uniref:PHD finger protein 20 isoform X4 n=1 Tax=Spodoptera frugiperda TaxID=7108 RepID=A0A9R0CU24_SPOFR|nr:PHD finger protein 20 isoform X4 [Spodoptera frugiperda]
MAVKKCCIDNCNSCSTRKEDKGVTYHKFPKNDNLRDIWVAVTHYKHTGTELPHFVCSRHFCKNDFQSYKDSKYKLKTDAVPSIFPWDSDTDEEMEDISAPVEGFSADCEVENVDAIKKFIEAQEKELQEQKLADFNISEKSNDTTDSTVPCHSETVCEPGAVMGMIHSESETDIDISKKKDVACKQLLSPVDKGNNSTMALSIGSKVEAKDFEEKWHTAEIIEVDYEEMEVLIHYEIDRKKHDEWISVSSPRLRPVNEASGTSSGTSSTVTVKPGPSSEESLTDTLPISSLKEESKEIKTEEKIKLSYEVGERCLARWRDNRRFVATILKDLGDGNYEIVFDDGCNWTCNTSRLHKLRSKQGSGTPSTSLSYGPGPSNANIQTAFHTHLFDPTRDYLGSKSERREMKRKLNIKEIFNIGQKKSRKQKGPDEKPHKTVERKPRILKKRRERPVKLKLESEIKTEPITEVPAVDAVASIIGTVSKEDTANIEVKEEEKLTEVTPDPVQEESKKVEEVQPQPEPFDDKKMETETEGLNSTEESIKQNDNEDDLIQLEDLKGELDPVLDEEVKLEKFEKQDDVRHEEVIDRIKEVINKLEDGLSQIEKVNSPKVEVELKEEIFSPEVKPAEVKEESDKITGEQTEKDKKKLGKVKKGKKLRLLREKKVNKNVENVKHELEKVKLQMSEMRKEILRPDFTQITPEPTMPETLLPNEWCCRWVNGQPLGTVSEIECEVKQQEPGSKPPLPRRSVQVEDKRLPEGWTKHMVRRSFGNSAGKWDVVLVSPDNRRFHTKNEMRTYLENNPSLVTEGYEHVLTDFGVHLKLARRMGWITHTAEGVPSAAPLPAGTLSCTSPLYKRKKLSLKKKRDGKEKRPKITIKMKVPKDLPPSEDPVSSSSLLSANDNSPAPEPAVEVPPLEDGYVYVGSLKVQIIENLLRCPAEGCYKNFRNNTLIQMHIKHYHRELRKMLGDTPKVLDLAYARTKQPIELESPRVTNDKVIKVKIPRPPKREEPKQEVKEVKPELQVDTTPVPPVKEPELPIPRSQDSPKLRQALSNKPVKRPRVLLPVRRPDPEPVLPEPVNEDVDVENTENIEPVMEIPPLDMALDFESAISTHTVTKPIIEKKRKSEKKRKTFAMAAKRPASEEEDWLGANSDFDTRSSFPRSGTPDSKADLKVAPVSSESNEENKDSNMYMYTENGERIKIVHMKREEIINCHCGFREEDGLMVQCELCLCWQHALCHNIQRECDVPEKYTCSICLNPRRGRRSQRFLHDQDRMYEGLLPGGKPCETLRRSHELAGNLLRIEDALHALRVKYYVATKKDHPKLYLWAKDWEQLEIQNTQEKLNSDYSDLNIMINMDKENKPIKPEDVKDIQLDLKTPPSEEQDQERYSHKDAQLGAQSLLSGLLSSPGDASLDLPISTSELERLAISVQEQEAQRAMIVAPQPEPPIENATCRRQLLKHLQRCQALIDARLDSIEAQVAELESQDPSFEDDETAEYFPRTKQTVQMLMRDLETMEELGVIT